MASVTKGYPLRFSVDYPEKLDRLTTFFRAFTIIPIAILFAALAVSFTSSTGSSGSSQDYSAAVLITTAPLVLMLLFRKKYPKWWFDWNLAVTRFGMRLGVYALLMRDEYPSTDEEQAVHLDIDYPDAEKDLMRGMPLVKWFLAIPHYIVISFLGIAAMVCWIIAWWAILFTGRFPQGLWEFIAGVLRWELRVCAYAVLLVTDRYPPFSLE
jgi:uncharacterized protein DUF4389